MKVDAPLVWLRCKLRKEEMARECRCKVRHDHAEPMVKRILFLLCLVLLTFWAIIVFTDIESVFPAYYLLFRFMTEDVIQEGPFNCKNNLVSVPEGPGLGVTLANAAWHLTLRRAGFLFLIGMILVADGMGHHVPKGYIYFAMAFSLAVEMLNLKMRKKRGLI